MVVQFVDDQGCVAWTAGYDGVQKMWVHARPPLAGLGPIFYDLEGLVRWDAGGRIGPLSGVEGKLPPAVPAAEPPICPGLKPSNNGLR